jgi:hypothetical protein
MKQTKRTPRCWGGDDEPFIWIGPDQRFTNDDLGAITWVEL